MPLYTYEHPKTKQRKDIFQPMTAVHEYIEDGVKWNRVFDAPNANVNSLSSIDPFSKKDFLDKTRDMKGGTLGDLWDVSAELSAKRAKKAGKDPIKEKAIKDYERKCHGKKHPHA